MKKSLGLLLLVTLGLSMQNASAWHKQGKGTETTCECAAGTKCTCDASKCTCAGTKCPCYKDRAFNKLQKKLNKINARLDRKLQKLDELMSKEPVMAKRCYRKMKHIKRLARKLYHLNVDRVSAANMPMAKDQIKSTLNKVDKAFAKAKECLTKAGANLKDEKAKKHYQKYVDKSKKVEEKMAKKRTMIVEKFKI
jgi:hypothetical protein